MATKIISSAERIIFRGHADTREECETISLACEELAKSEKFRTVKYESGYAEFEKVGKTAELKFLGDPGATLTIDSHILSVTLPTYGGDSEQTFTSSVDESTGGIVYPNAPFEMTVVLDVGYTIDTVTESYGPCLPLEYSVNGNIITFNTMPHYLTITSKQSTPTISFTRRYQNSTLIGTGTYKFRRYSVEEPVVTNQLSTPANVKVADGVASWEAVENATSYDIFVDGTIIGEYTPS